MEWLKHFVINRNEKGIFVNNLAQGKHYTKFENGNLSYEFNYANGKKHGTQHSWFVNNILHYEETWENGQQRGLWILYSLSIPFHVIHRCII